jgi:hypothetical protein
MITLQWHCWKTRLERLESSGRIRSTSLYKGAVVSNTRDSPRTHIPSAFLFWDATTKTLSPAHGRGVEWLYRLPERQDGWDARSSNASEFPISSVVVKPISGHQDPASLDFVAFSNTCKWFVRMRDKCSWSTALLYLSAAPARLGFNELSLWGTRIRVHWWHPGWFRSRNTPTWKQRKGPHDHGTLSVWFSEADPPSCTSPCRILCTRSLSVMRRNRWWPAASYIAHTRRTHRSAQGCFWRSATTHMSMSRYLFFGSIDRQSGTRTPEPLTNRWESLISTLSPCIQASDAFCETFGGGHSVSNSQ